MSLPDEPFSRGASPLHLADPRLKLPAALALILAVAVGQSLPAALAALLLGTALTLWARLPVRPLCLQLAGANLFIGFLWLVLPFTVPGEAVLTAGPLALSREGLRLCLLITLKCNAMLLLFTSLVATSSVPALGQALQSLRAPVTLCRLLLFTYRYIFVIAQEYGRLARAARLRGFRPANRLHTYRTYANLFGMTLVQSWNRAQRVQQAMELRGFTGHFHSLEPRRLTPEAALPIGGLLLLAPALAFWGLWV